MSRPCRPECRPVPNSGPCRRVTCRRRLHPAAALPRASSALPVALPSAWPSPPWRPRPVDSSPPSRAGPCRLLRRLRRLLRLRRRRLASSPGSPPAARLPPAAAARSFAIAACAVRTAANRKCQPFSSRRPICSLRAPLAAGPWPAAPPVWPSPRGSPPPAEPPAVARRSAARRSATRVASAPARDSRHPWNTGLSACRVPAGTRSSRRAAGCAARESTRQAAGQSARQATNLRVDADLYVRIIVIFSGRFVFGVDARTAIGGAAARTALRAGLRRAAGGAATATLTALGRTSPDAPPSSPGIGIGASSPAWPPSLEIQKRSRQRRLRTRLRRRHLRCRHPNRRPCCHHRRNRHPMSRRR